MKIQVHDGLELLQLLILQPIEKQRTEPDIPHFLFPKSTRALMDEAPSQEISFYMVYLKFLEFYLSSPNLFQSQKFS